jgi:hypothetical protein
LYALDDKLCAINHGTNVLRYIDNIKWNGHSVSGQNTDDRLQPFFAPQP